MDPYFFPEGSYPDFLIASIRIRFIIGRIRIRIFKNFGLFFLTDWIWVFWRLASGYILLRKSFIPIRSVLVGSETLPGRRVRGVVAGQGLLRLPLLTGSRPS